MTGLTKFALWSTPPVSAGSVAGIRPTCMTDVCVRENVRGASNVGVVLAFAGRTGVRTIAVILCSASE